MNNDSHVGEEYGMDVKQYLLNLIFLATPEESSILSAFVFLLPCASSPLQTSVMTPCIILNFIYRTAEIRAMHSLSSAPIFL